MVLGSIVSNFTKKNKCVKQNIFDHNKVYLVNNFYKLSNNSDQVKF